MFAAMYNILRHTPGKQPDQIPYAACLHNLKWDFIVLESTLDVRQNHLVFISGISGKLRSTFEGREITVLSRSDGCVPIRRGDQGVFDEEPAADVHTYVNNLGARAAEANRRFLFAAI